MGGKPARRVILVGCGLCARRNYVPALLRGETEVVAVVDADIEGGSARVDGLLAELGSGQPERLLVSKPEWETASVSTATRDWLRSIRDTRHVDALLIAAEARCHAAYTSAAVDLGFRVLVDKPVVVPGPRGVSDWREMFAQFDGLRRQRPGAVIEVMAQRRYHTGYQFLFQELEAIIRRHGVPLTAIEISYGGGEWRLPWEFRRENHPYHHGYGVLHHSGYHFVDLLARLVSLNDCLDDVAPDLVEVRVAATRLGDFLAQISPQRHGDLLTCPAVTPPIPEEADVTGEIDLWAQVRFLRGGRVITVATLSLIENSFSRRAWWQPNADVYQGNGRVKHERLVVQVGPLASYQCHSYSAGAREEPATESDRDGARHFEVSCFRNSGVIGGAAFETRPCGSHSALMREARAACLTSFLNGGPSLSALETHQRTNLLMALLAEALSREAEAGFDAQPSRTAWRLEP